MSAFVEAARQLVARVRFEDLKWRHHGLGMLQAELSDSLRVHIWHPKLRTPEMRGLRAVHDHRFSFESAVLVGAITDVPYDVRQHDGARLGGKPVPLVDPPSAPLMGDGSWVETKCWQIKHAEIQADAIEGRGERHGCSTADDVECLGPVFACVRRPVVAAARQRHRHAPGCLPRVSCGGRAGS